MKYKRPLGGPVLIVMDRTATAEDVGRVVSAAERLGLKAHPIPGVQRTAIGLTGNKGTIGPAAFENLPGVLEVIRVSHPYKLVSREFHPEDSVVAVGGVPVGGTALTVIAGPCAVESREQILAVAREVKRLGAHLLRGGAFKPRTSPYSFQGLGEPGLKLLGEARDATVAEVKAFYEKLTSWERGHLSALQRQADELKEEYWTEGHFWPF